MAPSLPRELSADALGAIPAPDSRVLRREIIHRLRRHVDFDWFVWVLTDPVTAVGIDPFVKIPDPATAGLAIRLKYLTSLNRWTTLTVAGSYGGRAEESALWRDVQRPAGVVDVACVAFRDAHGCWGFLDLWSARTFGADTCSLLDAFAAAATIVIRRERSSSFRRSTFAPSREGPALILLDDRLEVTGSTGPSDGLLRLLLPTPETSEPIPAAAFNVAAQLLAREAGVDDEPALARMPVADGSWVRVSAQRIAPDGRIAVSIEPASVDERLDLFVRAHGLTTREAAVLRSLARGADTADVARELFLSPYTVHDHLRAVFAKTGTHRRGELLARASGA